MDKIDDILIVDDIIPFIEQEAIKNQLLSRSFPWYKVEQSYSMVISIMRHLRPKMVLDV
jgi:hypothetical protein